MERKLRLIGKGFEHYTGAIGVTQFVDGLSTTTPHQMDVHRLTCTIGARWDDGSASSVGEGYEAAKSKPAPTVQEQAEREAAKVEAAKGPTKTYTEAELSAIADEGGITGLREVAGPLGVKAGSIKALIEGVMAVAGAPVAEEEKAAE